MHETGPAVVLYETQGKNFQRVLTESTLWALQTHLRNKLRLEESDVLELVQLWDGKEIDLIDDADFDAFALRSRRAGFATIRIMTSQRHLPAVSRTEPLQETSVGLPDATDDSTTQTAGRAQAQGLEFDLRTSSSLHNYQEESPEGGRNKSPNGAVNRPERTENVKKKRKKRTKEIASAVEDDSISRERVPTPEILKGSLNIESAVGSERIPAVTTARGKKRKLSASGKEGADSVKKPTKKSKSKSAESRASKPRPRDDAVAKGAVARPLSKGIEGGAANGEHPPFTGETDVGSLFVLPAEISAMPSKAPDTILPHPGQFRETGGNVEELDFLPSQALPPWTADRPPTSPPLQESFSDQINESQYHLPPPSGNTSPGLETPSISEPTLYAYEEEVESSSKLQNRQSSKARRDRGRSSSISGEDIPLAPKPKALPSRQIMQGNGNTKSSPDAAPLNRARERGETASVVDTGDQAFREIFSQENRRFSGFGTQSNAPELSLPPVARSIAESEGSVLGRDIQETSGLYTQRSRPEGGGISSQASALHPTRSSQVTNSRIIPTTQPSYPSLSSIVILPSHSRARSLSVPSTNAAPIDDVTDTDESEESDTQLSEQIPSNRRAGATLGTRRRRGLFDYFKLT